MIQNNQAIARTHESVSAYTKVLLDNVTALEGSFSVLSSTDTVTGEAANAMRLHLSSEILPLFVNLRVVTRSVSSRNDEFLSVFLSIDSSPHAYIDCDAVDAMATRVKGIMNGFAEDDAEVRDLCSQAESLGCSVSYPQSDAVESAGTEYVRRCADLISRIHDANDRTSKSFVPVLRDMQSLVVYIRAHRRAFVPLPVRPVLTQEQIDKLAYQTIRGDFGNGEVRKNRLKELFDPIQARVNAIFAAHEGPGPIIAPFPFDDVRLDDVMGPGRIVMAGWIVSRDRLPFDGHGHRRLDPFHHARRHAHHHLPINRIRDHRPFPTMYRPHDDRAFRPMPTPRPFRMSFDRPVSSFSGHIDIKGSTVLNVSGFNAGSMAGFGLDLMTNANGHGTSVRIGASVKA